MTPEREKEIRIEQENFREAAEGFGIANGAQSWWEKVNGLLAEIDRCREIAERDGKDYSAIHRKLAIAVEALEKIADPTKRDHKEPDAYTQLGCVMHIAEEALARIRGEKC